MRVPLASLARRSPAGAPPASVRGQAALGLGVAGICAGTQRGEGSPGVGPRAPPGVSRGPGGALGGGSERGRGREGATAGGLAFVWRCCGAVEFYAPRGKAGE